MDIRKEPRSFLPMPKGRGFHSARTLMKKQMRWYFWLEVCLASVTGILFVVTLIWRDWAEIIFHVDPDQGNGSFEWLIVGGLLVVTLVLFTLAGYQWRKAPLAIN